MLKKLLTSIILCGFLFNTLGQMPCYAQGIADLPKVGTMVELSPAYTPLLIKGLKVHPDNPLAFDFLVDTGNDLSLREAQATKQSQQEQLRIQSNRLIKYFFVGLTLPEKEMWVNLSPYEKNRVVPEGLGQTEMGRDLLAQDYILKQLTASLIYPEKDLGKEFWDRIYKEAQARFGTTQIPVNTFNKVWIVADKASVYEKNDTVLVTGGHLKVMLEEDYMVLSHKMQARNDAHTLASNIVREIVLPVLEKEVNEGKNFAPLRQIFYALILAKWYKTNVKEALLNQVYSDKGKTNGVEIKDKAAKERIYQQYVQAYKKGVFNYIKDPDSTNVGSGATFSPRKYFSGGMQPSPAEISHATEDEARRSSILVGDLASVAVNASAAEIVRTDSPRLKAVLQNRIDVVGEPSFEQWITKTHPALASNFLINPLRWDWKSRGVIFKNYPQLTDQFEDVDAMPNEALGEMLRSIMDKRLVWFGWWGRLNESKIVSMPSRKLLDAFIAHLMDGKDGKEQLERIGVLLEEIYRPASGGRSGTKAATKAEQKVNLECIKQYASLMRALTLRWATEEEIRRRVGAEEAAGAAAMWERENTFSQDRNVKFFYYAFPYLVRDIMVKAMGKEAQDVKSATVHVMGGKRTGETLSIDEVPAGRIVDSSKEIVVEFNDESQITISFPAEHLLRIRVLDYRGADVFKKIQEEVIKSIKREVEGRKEFFDSLVPPTRGNPTITVQPKTAAMMAEHIHALADEAFPHGQGENHYGEFVAATIKAFNIHHFVYQVFKSLAIDPTIAENSVAYGPLSEIIFSKLVSRGIFISLENGEQLINYFPSNDALAQQEHLQALLDSLEKDVEPRGKLEGVIKKEALTKDNLRTALNAAFNDKDTFNMDGFIKAMDALIDGAFVREEGTVFKGNIRGSLSKLPFYKDLWAVHVAAKKTTRVVPRSGDLTPADAAKAHEKNIVELIKAGMFAPGRDQEGTIATGLDVMKSKVNAIEDYKLVDGQQLLVEMQGRTLNKMFNENGEAVEINLTHDADAIRKFVEEHTQSRYCILYYPSSEGHASVVNVICYKSYAMRSDIKPAVDGGIDLNTGGMAMAITKQAGGVRMRLDQALVDRFRRGDFSGILPVIVSITPMASILPWLGLN